MLQRVIPRSRAPPHLIQNKRAFRASRPAEIGPLLAGVGAAAVLYGCKLLLQAASNPRFTEAMREAAAAAPQAARETASAASKGQSASKPATASSSTYFTTDVMGVDLGQGAKDWSAAHAAIMEGSVARVVENEQGSRSTPALVAFLDNGETLVGTPAKKLLFSRTATAVYSPQLLFGMTHSSPECTELLKTAELPYEVAAGAAGEEDTPPRMAFME